MEVEELAAGVTVELQVDTMVRISKWVDTEKGKCSKGYVCLKSVVMLQSTSSDWNLGT